MKKLIALLLIGTVFLFVDVGKASASDEIVKTEVNTLVNYTVQSDVVVAEVKFISFVPAAVEIKTFKNESCITFKNQDKQVAGDPAPGWCNQATYFNTNITSLIERPQAENLLFPENQISAIGRYRSDKIVYLTNVGSCSGYST